jgi:hypothetical protein
MKYALAFVAVAIAYIAWLLIVWVSLVVLSAPILIALYDTIPLPIGIRITIGALGLLNIIVLNQGIQSALEKLWVRMVRTLKIAFGD